VSLLIIALEEMRQFRDMNLPVHRDCFILLAFKRTPFWYLLCSTRADYR